MACFCAKCCIALFGLKTVENVILRELPISGVLSDFSRGNVILHLSHENACSAFYVALTQCFRFIWLCADSWRVISFSLFPFILACAAFWLFSNVSMSPFLSCSVVLCRAVSVVFTQKPCTLRLNVIFDIMVWFLVIIWELYGRGFTIRYCLHIKMVG